MASNGRYGVSMADVFPHGAYVVSEVEPVRDFDKSTPERFVQQLDKQTGLPLWAVSVLDADPEARKGDKTVTVKIMDVVQPVPPETTGGTPFRPVEFEGLTVTPYLDDKACRAPQGGELRTFVLVAAMCSLRWGEITGLRRCDVDEDGSSIRITSQLIELSGQGLVRGVPKSRAGRRTVTVPLALRADLVRHLAEHVGPNLADLVFTMQRGGPMRRGNFNPTTNWKRNATEIGVPNLHFHDLRHTGNTLAATTGASLRDLMTRMGHDSTRAAMIYQHATNTADQLIADGLSLLIDQHCQDGNSGHVEGTNSEDPDAPQDGVLPRTTDELR